MLCPCQFIILTIHTESQMSGMGLYSEGYLDYLQWGLYSGRLIFGILRYDGSAALKINYKKVFCSLLLTISQTVGIKVTYCIPKHQ